MQWLISGYLKHLIWLTKMLRYFKNFKIRLHDITVENQYLRHITRIIILTFLFFILFIFKLLLSILLLTLHFFLSSSFLYLLIYGVQ